MTKILKKVLSVVLVFCMLMSMFSMTALADDQTEGELPASSGSQPGEANQAPDTEPIHSTGMEEEKTDPAASEEPQVPGENQETEESEEMQGSGINEFKEETGSAKEDVFEADTPAPAANEDDGDDADESGWNEDSTVLRLVGSGTLEKSVVDAMLNSREGSGEWSVEITGYTTIGAKAFQYRGSLVAVTFEGDALTTIGEAAFDHCINLDDIEIPASVTTIVKWAFNDTSLGNLSFAQNSSLRTIGDKAFANVLKHGNGSGRDEWGQHDSLTDLSMLPDSVTTIGESAFYGRKLLAAVHIPGGVRELGKWAFYRCESLSTVEFGENSQLVGVGIAAFQYCVALESIELPDSVTTLTEYCFAGSGLTTISFPANITYIKNQALAQCKDLEHVIIPEGVDVSDGAFVNSKLTQLDDGKHCMYFMGTKISGTWATSVTFVLNNANYDFEKGMPIKDGYEFQGWYTNVEDETTKAESFENGVTYYAKWQCLHGDTTTTDTATCGQDGTKTIVCDICGEVVSEENSPATGAHTWDEGTVTTGANCTTAGTHAYVCTVCGETRNEVIPSHGHVWSRYETTQEPAEGVPGVETSTCSICGDSRTRSIDALPETPVDPDPVDSVDPDPIDPENPDDDTVDIPDEDPPLSEDPDDGTMDIPDEDPPLSEDPDDDLVDIPDDDPPLSEEPDIFDTPEDPVKSSEAPAQEQQPVLPAQDGETIDDGDVPLADVPQTGDSLALWLGAAAMSGMGLVAVTVSERKRKEQDGE